MQFQEMSDKAILKEIGKRVTEHRLNQNLSKEQLAEEAGVGVATVYRLENGKLTQLSTFTRILRVLGLLSNLEVLLPELPPSPMAKLESRGKKRLRATKSTSKEENTEPWAWGDD